MSHEKSKQQQSVHDRCVNFGTDFVICSCHSWARFPGWVFLHNSFTALSLLSHKVSLLCCIKRPLRQHHVMTGSGMLHPHLIDAWGKLWCMPKQHEKMLICRIYLFCIYIYMVSWCGWVPESDCMQYSSHAVPALWRLLLHIHGVLHHAILWCKQTFLCMKDIVCWELGRNTCTTPLPRVRKCNVIVFQTRRMLLGICLIVRLTLSVTMSV